MLIFFLDLSAAEGSPRIQHAHGGMRGAIMRS